MPAVQRLPALESARPVEHLAKPVWQCVQQLVLRLVSFVAPFYVPLDPWVVS
jgi:hypothetical protein